MRRRSRLVATNEPPRRGTAYLLAVGLALLLGAVATGTLLATRARFAGEADMADVAKAKALRASGLAIATNLLNTSSTYAAGTVPSTATVAATIGDGRLRYQIAAAADDGDPSTLTPATVTVAAAVGRAVRRCQVTFHPVFTAPSAFDRPLAVGGNVGVTNGARLTVSATTHGAAASVVTVGTGMVVGTISPTATGMADEDLALQASLDRPSLVTSAQIDALKASATAITIAGAGPITITNVLLSPMVNPYGSLNQRGLYVLECAGRNVTISDSRIVGTLILVNPGSSSLIGGAMLMEAAVRGYPALVVDGNMTINASATRLSESTVNFNPHGTPSPYAGGTVDQDLVDQYIARIKDPVIVTGYLTFQGTATIVGLQVGRDLAVLGDLTVSHCDWSVWSPAPELVAARWRPDPESLVEVDSGP